MHPNRTYSLPCLLVLVGPLALGLSGCSSNAKIGSDIEPTTTSGGAAGTGGTHGSAPTGGKSSAGGAAATGTGGSKALAPLPKACHGIAFDTQAANADAGTTIDPDAGTQCGGTGIEIEPAPLDMYIMMDRTYSMTYEVTPGVKRWDVLQQGVQQFLFDASLIAEQPRIGLGFFGATGNPDDLTECLADTYAKPLLAIENISTVTQKIISSLQNEQQYLGGQTPWLPSLQGALEYAQTWQQANPIRMTVVVFVTDGYPTECDTDVNDILEVVGEYFSGVQGIYNAVGKPSIRTYIIGVGGEVGSNRFNLDSVAMAGGTGAATIADSSGAIDQFASSMANITKANIQCTYPLTKPRDSGQVNPSQVQVVYEPFDPQSHAEQFPMARTAGDCNSTDGGWYFDDPINPTTITLCPCTCANLGAGSVQVRLGCYPIRIIG